MSERKIVRLADVRKMEFIPPRSWEAGDLPGSVVILDGHDISSICFRAVEYDDGTLDASIYQRTQDGGYLLTGNTVSTEELTGKGSVTPR